VLTPASTALLDVWTIDETKKITHDQMGYKKNPLKAMLVANI
jgi:hypothetical protein